MFKEKKKTKKYGRKVVCDNCGKVIYVDSDEEKENIVTVSNVKIYSCFCGEEFVIDK